MKDKHVAVLWIIWFLTAVFATSQAYGFEVSKTESGNEIKWPVSNAVYYVNPAGGPENTLAAVQAAMQSWNGVSTSSFSFIYGGTTTAADWDQNDNVNTVTFGPLDDDTVLAENYGWYHQTSGVIWGSDIKVNLHQPWSTNGNGNAYDLQSVLTHELGHSLRLSDLYDAADSGKVMYGYIYQGTIRRTLSQDERDGITHLYPLSSCSFPFLPASQSFSSSGGTGNINVVTKDVCAWQAVSNDPSWIRINTGSSGFGSGIIQYAVSANTQATTRTGTLTIAGNTFTVIQAGIQSLTVFKSGSGSGVVKSAAPGIDCGTDCAEIYGPASVVTLTATPAENSVFSGWSGSCTGLATTCAVIMNSEKRVMADFTEKASVPAVKGDIDGSGHVDLKDAVAAFRILTGLPPGNVSITENTDMNGNRKIGLEEAVSLLQYLAGRRSINKPILYAIGNKTIDENATLFFTVFAAHPNGEALMYAMTSLPEGAVFDQHARSFSWQPTYAQSGTYNITAKVTDSLGAEATETVTITVNDKAPVFNIDDYYPLNMDDWWEYKNTVTGDVHRETVTGTKIIGSVLTKVLTKMDGTKAYYKTDASSIKQYGQYSVNEIYTGDVIFDPPVLMMSNNAQIGTSITSSTTYSFTYSGYLIHVDGTETTTVMGLEDVITANAMLKDCVKITTQMTQRIRETGQVVNSTETDWFYKGVGIVKQVTEDKNEIITASCVNGLMKTY